MKNYKIGKKLTIAFGSVIVVLGIMAAAAIIGLTVVSSNFTTFYDGPYQTTTIAMDIRRAMQQTEKHLILSLLTTDKETIEQEISTSTTAIELVKENLEKLEQSFTGDKTLIAETEPILLEGGPLREELYALTRASKNDEALALYREKYQQLAQDLRDKVNAISVVADEDAASFYRSAAATQRMVLILVIALTILALAVALVFCLYIIRSITKPIAELEHAAQSMAEGNLNAEIEYTSNDEMGSLSDSMRSMMFTLRSYVGNISELLTQMAGGNMAVSADMDYAGDFAPIKTAMEQIVASLNDTLWQINQSADQVASGSDQVSSGAQELSQGATEQASSIEELSATVAEISEQIRLNAGNALETNTMAGEMGSEIARGNQQMEQLVTAMNDISATTDQIGKIIKAIDDIAFQTNILALNAAVEAARAGAAGKGFAVVADEVRNLAAKSADAAKNTTDLIANSINAVKNGSVIAVNTAKSLEEIKVKAQKTIALVDEIAKASGDQASAVVQITQGIEQISVVIQTNSATAEESAAASEELNGQAQVLRELVGQFTLKETAFMG